ncbi:TlpA family protein disulfide reductase [Heliorestis acidaminivorans]|uniref:TlpA family protein disulfide reductase n=1 Tax=Heliorestis acidaminivorans TaxID=553427 RepID=A0A6I0F0D5_9FIRM|nr:TlpA disulfide reductase family protein [Heliorestis acidaminivorans]KAB2952524.1 TlpA family protein disulfide reductase [Heliorestis acidaminivorans]
MKKAYRYLLPFLLLALALFLGGCGADEERGTTTTSFGLRGQVAPDFTLKSLDGETLSLADVKGKPIVLNFWATTCPYCLTEKPHMNQFYAENKDDVVIIGVNLTFQDDLRDVNKFLELAKITFPIVLDESGDVTLAYHVGGLPTTYFIDKNGVIQNVKMGAISSKSELEAFVAPLR